MRASRSLAAITVVALSLGGALAGCVAPVEVADAPTAPADVLSLVRTVELLDDGGYRVGVPIEVFLVGFGPEVAPALQAALRPEPVDHLSYSIPNYPLDARTFPAAARATAHFFVRDFDAATDAAFLEAASGWKLAESALGAYDANAAEAWLAAELARLRGAPLDREAPVFVILHAGALGNHTWRYAFPKGHYEPARVFGEKLPLTVFDVSADPDPYVAYGRPPDSALRVVQAATAPPYELRPYDVPIDASGDDVAGILAELAIDAVHYRFLKGPLYPISTKPCHQVTLLLAVHATTLTDALPGFTRAADLVDAEGLRSAFANLTGDEVLVEAKTLVLPLDDPVLDALSRQAGAYATYEPMRQHLQDNWATYVTPSDGCAEVLSVMLLPDLTGETRQYNGVALYDVDRDRRLAFSIVSDLTRFRREIDGPLSTADPSENWDAVNFLHAHEAGHVFGLQHPNSLAKVDAPFHVNPSFDAVYTPMGYQTGTRISDFGAVDFATWTRGRTGQTIAEARALGLEDTPEFAAALAALAEGRWKAAHLALEPLLTAADASGDAGARASWARDDAFATPPLRLRHAAS